MQLSNANKSIAEWQHATAMQTNNCYRYTVCTDSAKHAQGVCSVTLVTLCAFAQQGYAFGRVGLYVAIMYNYLYLHIYMYVNKKQAV